jgi:hypothetical protein
MQGLPPQRRTHVTVAPDSRAYWARPSGYFARAIRWRQREPAGAARLSPATGPLPARSGVSAATEVYDARPGNAGLRTSFARLRSIGPRGPDWDGPITANCTREELEMLLMLYRPVNQDRAPLRGPFRHGVVAEFVRRVPARPGHPAHSETIERPMAFRGIPHQVLKRVHLDAGLRHQWAVIGGDARASDAAAQRVPADRSAANFLGYLEAALLGSGFAP